MQILMRVSTYVLYTALFFAWTTIGGRNSCFAETSSLASPPVLLQMIRDNAVHEELNVNDQQKQKFCLLYVTWMVLGCVAAI